MARPPSALLTIVVVDDELDFRLIVRALLRGVADLTTIVGEAADGDEALALVRRTRPDILISDVIMPGLNGVDLARRVRAELPQTRTILMSSHVDDAYRLMASDSGADVFINKHVITSSLLPAVRDLISRSAGAGGSGRPNGGTSSSSMAPPK
ncbi:MAG TPA: response regulator transcription factor [Methylomirabilota bacterium]